MEVLPTIWFGAIALLWIGYLVLEGFDLGVGMHVLFGARTEATRRTMLNTIGPVWDGNEVWLITAGAGTFAAFPYWYASLFSALYVPLVLVLVGLIFRAVAIEYRGKVVSAAWQRFWTYALGIGSLVVAFGIGAALALTTTGLPINANGDRVGGAFAWFSPMAVVGGLAVVGFCYAHAAAFLALKTEGAVQVTAQRTLVRWSPLLLLPLVIWVLVVQFSTGSVLSWIAVLVAVGALVFSWLSGRAGRDGRSFAGMVAFVAFGAGSIFLAVYPVVLPSTIDSAFGLTVQNAASGTYTLTVMTIVALVGLPLVLLYQGWAYWVFRKRISTDHIPEAHPIAPAVVSR